MPLPEYLSNASIFDLRKLSRALFNTQALASRIVLDGQGTRENTPITGKSAATVIASARNGQVEHWIAWVISGGGATLVEQIWQAMKPATDTLRLPPAQGVPVPSGETGQGEQGASSGQPEDAPVELTEADSADGEDSGEGDAQEGRPERAEEGGEVDEEYIDPSQTPPGNMPNQTPSQNDSPKLWIWHTDSYLTADQLANDPRIDTVIKSIDALKEAVRRIGIGRASEQDVADIRKVTLALAEKIKALESGAIGGVSEARVKALVDAALANQQSASAMTITIARADQSAPPVSIGLQHRQFADLLAMLQAGCHVYVWGNAGHGKTRAAMEAAKALGLSFAGASICNHSTKTDFLGFRDAMGNTNKPGFRLAYENGGIYLLSEADAGNPNVLMTFNTALENGFCEFPDGVIPMHKDFRMVCDANTDGRGRTVEFTGRNSLDKAFLERFLVLPWEADPALETAITCQILGHQAGVVWSRYVQSWRKEHEARGLHVVTPRASYNGAKMIKAGIRIALARTATLERGLDVDTIKEINAKLPLPTVTVGA